MENNNSKWRNTYINISKLMSRRNFIYQEKINEFSYLFHHNETGKPCILVLLYYEKVGVDILKNHLKIVCNDLVKHYILIVEKHITSTCMKLLNDFFQYEFELFYLKNFYYDIKNLYYYIPHIKVTDEKEILNLKEIYDNKLPILLKTDPIAAYFGFSKGDIIRIERSSEEIIYRIVK